MDSKSIFDILDDVPKRAELIQRYFIHGGMNALRKEIRKTVRWLALKAIQQARVTDIRNLRLRYSDEYSLGCTYTPPDLPEGSNQKPEEIILVTLFNPPSGEASALVIKGLEALWESYEGCPQYEEHRKGMELLILALYLQRNFLISNKTLEDEDYASSPPVLMVGRSIAVLGLRDGWKATSDRWMNQRDEGTITTYIL
jgi:hypothetical protein